MNIEPKKSKTHVVRNLIGIKYVKPTGYSAVMKFVRLLEKLFTMNEKVFLTFGYCPPFAYKIKRDENELFSFGGLPPMKVTDIWGKYYLEFPEVAEVEANLSEAKSKIMELKGLGYHIVDLEVKVDFCPYFHALFSTPTGLREKSLNLSCNKIKIKTLEIIHRKALYYDENSERCYEFCHNLNIYVRGCTPEEFSIVNHAITGFDV